MQQLVILLLINCSSTCFGRLYVHPQEVRRPQHVEEQLINNKITNCCI